MRLPSPIVNGNERGLVHGDFRVGNLMVGPAGLVGVFDWEFAHVGDPVEELGLAVRAPPLRTDGFRLAGLAPADDFVTTYEGLSGRKVLPETLRYWEIVGNLRWAVGCVAQAHRHLSGVAPNLELASLGRRTAEMELELIELLEREKLP